MHKRLLALAATFLMCILALSFTYDVPKSQRAKYNFNSDWKVVGGDPKGAESTGFNDSAWKSVATPYAWNEDDAFRQDIHDLRTGIAWYRKHFKLPADSAEKKVFLEFEGIRHGGEFYLNGKSIEFATVADPLEFKKDFL